MPKPQPALETGILHRSSAASDTPTLANPRCCGLLARNSVPRPSQLGPAVSVRPEPRNLGVLRRNGVGSDPLRIPKTFIPIDLTLQVPRTQIMESADFRRTVGGGLVKIVTPEYAELILNTEEGRAEQERTLPTCLVT